MLEQQHPYKRIMKEDKDSDINYYYHIIFGFIFATGSLFYEA